MATINIRLVIPTHLIEDFKGLGAFCNPHNNFWYITKGIHEKPSQLINDYKARRIFLEYDHLEVLKKRYDLKRDTETGKWWVAEKYHRKLVLF